jgi:DNA-binding transcriptional regulator/RsmH inhibitor MraZ
MGERMEVWSAARYAERVLADDVDFAALAEEVRRDLEAKPNSPS